MFRLPKCSVCACVHLCVYSFFKMKKESITFKVVSKSENNPVFFISSIPCLIQPSGI